jgi:hypothetical protein
MKNRERILVDPLPGKVRPRPGANCERHLTIGEFIFV